MRTAYYRATARDRGQQRHADGNPAWMHVSMTCQVRGRFRCTGGRISCRGDGARPGGPVRCGGIVCLRAKAELTGSLFVIIMLLVSAGLGYTGLKHLLLH